MKKFLFIFSVNCQWSSWGKWSSCSNTCGTGVEVRRRTESTKAKYGGKKCVGKSKATRSCTDQKGIPVNTIWIYLFIVRPQVHYLLISEVYVSNILEFLQAVCKCPLEIARLVNKVGARVARGKHWQYGNQDGGAGGKGTVIRYQGGAYYLVVRWDNGNVHGYVMRNGKYDLTLAECYGL